MKRRVRVLRRAETDADDVYEWLRRRSPTGAAAWFAALGERLESIASGWNGSPAPEASAVDVDLRQAFFKTSRGRTYRVLFLETIRKC
jgi:plasmid stabilization system protein ParE